MCVLIEGGGIHSLQPFSLEADVAQSLHSRVSAVYSRCDRANVLLTGRD